MENELPQELQEGWRIFCMWAEARANAGAPLPPGGIFMLNRHTVLKDELFQLRARIVHRCKLAPSAVTIDVKMADGGLYPDIKVEHPEDRDKAEINDTVERCCEAFKESLMDRLAHLNGRPELRQYAVEDLLAQQ